MTDELMDQRMAELSERNMNQESAIDNDICLTLLKSAPFGASRKSIIICLTKSTALRDRPAP